MIHGSTLSISDAGKKKGQPGPRAHQGTSTRDLLHGQLENPSLWAAIGLIYEKQREYAMAAGSFRHGSELDPVDSDIAFAWARSALASGDYNGAKKAIQHLRDIDPLRVGPALIKHPLMVEGKRAEEAAMAREKPIVKVQVGPRTSGIIPQKPNPNTVPAQDATQNAAPRQV